MRSCLIHPWLLLGSACLGLGLAAPDDGSDDVRELMDTIVSAFTFNRWGS